MKVVLARPCWDYPKGAVESTYNRVWPPLDLANCAAVLRNAGHDANIIDAQALNLPPDKLASHSARADLVILTSTGLDRWQCPYNDALPFVAAARALKAAGLRFAVTGFHGTINPSAVISATGADFVLRGEPEGIVRDLAASKDPRDLAGVSYARGAEIVSNPDSPPVDLAKLPVPAFDLLDTPRYFYEILGRNFLLFEATRGCPYQCTFCSKVMYGKAFRKKELDQVCAEIDYALQRTPVKCAYFIDLEFAVARDLAAGICEHLIRRRSPLAWCCQTRAGNLDEELVALMKRAGCRLVHVGVESGSDDVLASSGKATTKDAIFRGVRMLEKAGIETLAFFMFGLPGETDAQREETIRFAIDLDPTYASFHFATPYPGSHLSDESGFRMADDLSFPLVPAGEDLAALKHWVSRAVRKFYMRPSYVWRHLLKGGPMKWPRQLRLFLSYMR